VGTVGGYSEHNKHKAIYDNQFSALTEMNTIKVLLPIANRRTNSNSEVTT